MRMKGAVEAGRFFLLAGFLPLRLPFGFAGSAGFDDAESERFGSEKSVLFAMVVWVVGANVMHGCVDSFVSSRSCVEMEELVVLVDYGGKLSLIVAGKTRAA